jgi:hypothetical protein
LEIYLAEKPRGRGWEDGIKEMKRIPYISKKMRAIGER